MLNEPHELLTRAKAVDAKLAKWIEMIPVHWIPHSVSADDVPQSVIDAGMYGDKCDIYPDIMICSIFNDWRVVRLKVLGLVARLDSNDSCVPAMRTMQRLVDGISASIPFSLGSRTTLGPLYEMKVEYPSLPGCTASKAHHTTACAYGGWYLFAPLKETMNVARYLRAGQREWLNLQLLRLAAMFDVEPA